MRKRLLQVILLVGFVGVMCLFGNVQVAIARAEQRIENEQVEEDEEAKKRAQAAWLELEENCPELHMGCASSVEDVIAMRDNVELPKPTVNEVVEEQGKDVGIGTVYSAVTPPLVAVDAGHLGYTVEKYKNTGAVSVTGMVEHEWSIQVARALKDELVERGYDVYMVRDTDEWSEFPYNNGERTEAANNLNCDILVAIHWDSFEQQDVDGYHTIYKGKGNTPAYRLAKAISDCYGEAVGNNVVKFSDPVARNDLW